MKSSKKIYSECFKKFELSTETLNKLQETLLDMFLDIKKVCDENNITYMMSGGSLLGTIRHKGFIPWDDDIDIMMTREEYHKLKRVFDKSLSNKYSLVEPLSSKKYVFKQPKIFKKGTKYIEIATSGVHAFDEVFIDIFIIENVPKPGIIRKIISFLYDFSFKASSVCVDYIFPSKIIEKQFRYSKELKKYYTTRRRIGFIFSHLGGMSFYLKITDVLAKSAKRSGWMGVPSAISYEKEIFEEAVFRQVTKGLFCGIEVNIPVKYDKYLRNLYGDYMTIPPVEKREQHTAYKIEL